jgi:hypothetical protein
VLDYDDDEGEGDEYYDDISDGGKGENWNMILGKTKDDELQRISRKLFHDFYSVFL